MISPLWLTPTLILGAGVADDLMTRKVHNKLVLAALAVAIAHVLWFNGAPGLIWGFLGLVAGIFLTLPLVLFKIIGAGDMKILAAFGMASDWETVTNVVVYSILWAALLGLFQVILGKSSRTLISNLSKLLIAHQRPAEETLHRIPYTVAFFFGWLTHLAIISAGVSTGGVR